MLRIFIQNRIEDMYAISHVTSLLPYFFPYAVCIHIIVPICGIVYRWLGVKLQQRTQCTLKFC